MAGVVARKPLGGAQAEVSLAPHFPPAEEVRQILTSVLPTVFSAGLDLKLALNFDGAALRGFIEVFYYEMQEALYRLGKPVIAAVNGHARASAG